MRKQKYTIAVSEEVRDQLNLRKLGWKSVDHILREFLNMDLLPHQIKAMERAFLEALEDDDNS